MEQFVNAINDIIWSNALIILCLVAGIYFSITTRFLQVRYVKEMVRLLFDGKSSEQGVSSFQAFAIAISGRVGTGNIAGVATAIAMGGPGAVFWMWAIAFLGAASAFIEATLGQIYKEVKDGQYRGGPAYYIEKGLGIKWYAVVFAVATILSTALLLPGVQSNSIALGVKNAFNIPVEYTGIVVCILLGLIIFGGVKRIGKVAEIVVPFMAGGYILMALIIILYNYEKIPETFGLIFKSAFALEPTFAGIFGMAVAWGVKRGIYSNEAGQGTAPHPAAAAETSHPAKQGLVQAFSVYIDTLFVCTATALMILFTGKYNILNPDGGFIVENVPGMAVGSEFTQNAVNTIFPSLGAGFVSIALFFFAFTTIMAYYYIAETNFSYLLEKGGKTWMIQALRIMIIAATFYGSVKSAALAWTIGDIGVGLMAWLNIIAIFLLRKPAFAVFKDYEKQRKAGKDPVFVAKDLGIKNTTEWE
ncbi:alanine/glycine:cation symporter family protein [Lacihabitans soyangensis]|jgi:alanine or glycine:cation symporter, AGCS family|uniref:Alanine:cation symporter family protein n=1 Tax=Lacihabitans soyangensis TaxID=869394 RepID=A0AAE3H5S7_9BACT|nr:alanine/glycine:cation symporter family protein [Lacihabitans soyangensis]MCP9764720.1 alanine:cation symporter family protein [Lacihabitans soyangensis]